MLIYLSLRRLDTILVASLVDLGKHEDVVVDFSSTVAVLNW